MDKVGKILYFLILLAMMRTVPSFSRDGVRFDSNEWDFGRIKEIDGAVSHTFLIINDSSSPLMVSRAVPGCSCITAIIPKEVVAPGCSAELEVFYLPSGADGVTYRSIDILESGGSSLGTLNVRADVVPADRSIQERYPFTVSDMLYVSRKSIPFGYLGHGKTLSKVIYLANASAETMEVGTLATSSPFFDVSCPAFIGPGKELPVLLTWTMPSDRSFIATCRDTVWFCVNGKRSVNPVVVSAVCTDVAAKSPSAPGLQVFPSQAQLKKSLFTSDLSGRVSIGNVGRTVLEIMAVELPEGVSADIRGGTRLHPGETVTMNVKTKDKLNVEIRVNIFTNDPIHPYKEIIFKP